MVTETNFRLVTETGDRQPDHRFNGKVLPGGRVLPNRAARRVIVIWLGCFLMIACKKEDSPPPSPPPVSSLSFTYNGEKNGSYSAVGEHNPSSADPWTYEWAGAGRFTDFLVKYILIISNSEVSASPYISEFFRINIPDKGKGTFKIPTWGSEYIIFNYSGGTTTGDEYYDVSAGTVIVTTYSMDRLAGTFTASLKKRYDQAKTISITNGKFDLKLRGP